MCLVVTRRLVDLARENQAARVEAYPVQPFHEPRAYRGTEEQYRRLGFTSDLSEPDGEFQILLMSRDL